MIYIEFIAIFFSIQVKSQLIGKISKDSNENSDDFEAYVMNWDMKVAE